MNHKVQLWYQGDVNLGNRSALIRLLQQRVADDFSFRSTSHGPEAVVEHEVDCRMVEVLDFRQTEGPCQHKVIIEVSAYPYEERLRDMIQRLRRIANSIALVLHLDPDDVSIAFRPEEFQTTGAGR